AAAGLQLDVVNNGADRDVLQGQRVARLDIDPLARNDLVARLEALRRQDVGELAVVIADERNERGPVRIVFEPLDRRGHVELAPLEVDDAIALLVAAANVPAGLPAVIVAPARLALALGQRLDRAALPKAAAVDQYETALAGR